MREGVEHPQVMELGLSLLKSLNWVGIAMVEFKVDPRDGIPKLMEVNPRFWGSLQLAIVSGVDFPYLILKMARGEKFEPILHYPCLLYTSPSPRDGLLSRMPSSA